ncbi:CHAT domain-containing protein [Persicitalea jodogahamensis]|uniref:CHAT domain-containing protein n=1 Tax=Persicitalea jodogahamensis TaxID=402147 RepID=A0A8J3G7B3_9BACT|nr:CHAT domain-containing protein [Persicitalea jodogahamensis]GHB51981.1 hypothetical protein GCM10007390_00720 [Persicitalea jodogahamensis]
MRTLLLGLGLYFLANIQLFAQCQGRTAFHSRLQGITATGFDSLALVRQRQNLEGWLSDYQKCYPVADSNYVSALNELARVHYYFAYSFNTDIAPAIVCSQRVIDAYAHPNLTLKNSDLVLANYRQGVYYDYDNAAEKSILALSKAIELGKDQPQASQSLNSAYPYVIGHYRMVGDYDRALNYAEEGEKVALRVGDDVITSKLLVQKSQVLAELGRLPEARQTLERAIALILQFPEHHRTLSGEERMLGGILYDMGQLDESLSHYHLAYAMAKKNNNENLSDYATSLGAAYLDMGNDAKAQNYFQEALRINKSKSSKSILLDYMALLQRKRKNFERALNYHQQGLNALSIGFDQTSVASLPAARLIRLASHRDYFLSIVQDKADTWLDYARHTGDDRVKLKHALRTYMLADSLIDLMRRDHTGEGTKLHWRSKARTTYERAIQTCYLLNDPVAALHFFEKSRAVLLNDQLNEHTAEAKLNAQQKTEEQKLRQATRNLEKLLTDETLSDTSLTRLRGELLAMMEEQDAFIDRLEKTNPRYFYARYDNRVPGLSAIRQKLIDGQAKKSAAFLSYFVGDSAVYGICVSPERITFQQLNREKYWNYLNEMNRLLISREAQNGHFPDYLKAAYGLYQVLVEPFELEAHTKLIISPDGPLIPFAALSLSPTKPNYLVLHHAISYTYSAGFLERAPRQAEGWWPSSRTFLGMAPVDFAPDLKQVSLTQSDQSLDNVSKEFFFAKNLVKTAASRGAFLKQAPRHRVVQLFTHATADSSRVEPKLYFADSLLRLSEVPGTPFLTQLMVLSACRTGIGQNQRGEGVFSLARGFAAVGIPSTLTTLWSVEDKPTYRLTELFHQNVSRGLSLDEALQNAQRAWLADADPEDQLPYAWAGLVLIGQAEPVCQKHYAGIWIVGGILLLGLGVLVFWNKRRNWLSSFATLRDSP